MHIDKKGAASFGTIVAIFGSILIALGFAWLIAQNWHQIPALLKIIILLGATSAAYVAGTMLRVHNYEKIAGALLALGALLYSLSIFLIAQIYFTSASFQGQAWLWLICWVGVIAAAYIFDSSISLVIALVEFVIWLFVQFLAFSINDLFDVIDSDGEITLGILAFYLLATGALVYGLSLLHRAKNHKFAGVYQWWTAFYFLGFAYLISFQVFLTFLWPKDTGFSTPAIVFLFFLVLIAIVVLISGVMASVRRNIVENKELIGFIAVVVLLALLIGSTSMVSGLEPGWSVFGGHSEVSSKLWAIWIFANIIFIGLILAVIFYGTWQRLPKLINLGIVFFALDIITRYIGFIMDLWGYTSLSVIFITGGVILLFGGWFIEKWRRNLIMKIKSK